MNSQNQQEKITALQKQIEELKAANKKLQTQSKKADVESYNNIFNITDDAIFIHNIENGMLVDVNNSAIKMYGFSKEDILKSSPELTSAGGDYNEENAIEFLKLAMQNKPQSFEWHAKRKNGELFWVNVSIKMADFGGEKRILAIVKNIDQQKNAELSLKESNELYRNLFELSPAAIFLGDKNGTILDVNPAYRKTMQYNRKELVGKNIKMVTGPEDDKTEIKKNIDAILSGEKLNHVVRSIRKDKSLCFMHLNEKRIRLPNGEYGFLSIAQDITERVKAEKELQKNEQLLRTTSSLSTDYSYSLKFNPDGTVENEWSFGAFQKITGYDPVKIWQDGSIEKLFHPDDTSIMEDRALELMKGKTVTSEVRVITKTGQIKWIRDTGKPVWNEKKEKVVRIIGSATDITEQKNSDIRLKQKLNEANQIYKITSATNNKVVLKNIYQLAFEVLENTVNIKRASISLFDSKGIMRFKAWSGISAKFRKEIESHSPWITKDKNPKPLNIQDTLKDKNLKKFKTLLQKEKINCMAFIPLTYKGFVKGQFILYSDTRCSLRNEELRFAQTIGHQIITAYMGKQFEDALHKSEEKYRRFFMDDISGDYITSLDGTLIDCNPSFLKIFGFKNLKEAQNFNMYNLYPEKKARKEFLDKIKKQKNLKNSIVEMHRVNGDQIALIESVRGVFDLKGKLIQLRGYLIDITKQNDAEKALRKSEEHFRSLIENSNDCIVLYNREGIIQYISPSVKRILGYVPFELLNKSSTDLIFNDDKKMATDIYKAMLAKPGRSVNFNIRVFHKKGDPAWIDTTMINLLENPSVNAIVVNFTDITERKKAEQEREEHIKYLENIDKMEFVLSQSVDVNTLLTNALQEMLNIFDCDRVWLMYPCDPKTKFWHVPMEVTKKNYKGLLAKGQEIPLVKETSNLFKASLDSGAPLVYDKSSRRKLSNFAQKEFNVQSQIHIAIHPKSGHPWLLGMHQCSFERTWTQREQNFFKDVANRLTESLSSYLFLNDLRKSEQLFRAVTEQSGEGISLANIKGDYVLVNPAFCKMTGYSKEELLKMNIIDLLPPKDKLEIFPKAQKGQLASKAKKVMRKNKSLFDAEISGFPVSLGSQSYVLGIVRDMTDRKKAELDLLISEESYRGLFNNASDAIYIQDYNGIFLDVNKTVEKMYGYKRDFLIGKTPEYLSAPGKNDLLKIKRHIKEAITGKIQRFEFWGIRENGDIFPKEVSLSLGTYFGQNVIIAFAQDITERKKAEEEHKQLEAQIQHAQKLESLGILSGGIAHDFNNLLTGILGNVGLAEIDLPDSSPVHANLKNIETSSIRAADLCRQLLAYSGKGKFIVKALNLNEVIEEMGTLLKTSISKKVSLEYNFSKNIPAVEVDTAQIRQVIMNLIINASDAIGKKNGVISLSTGTLKVNEPYMHSTFFNHNLKTGKYIYLDVADNGSGMDEETKAKIFDPFFTTKFTGRGLGLAAVLGIIRGHNGAIKINSRLNEGTTFRVLFPASDKKAVALTKSSIVKENLKSEGTILIVDDENSILDLGKNALSKAGFRVLTAEDGREALKVYKKDKNITAVLLDMTMPNMSGVETFHKLRSIDPDIKVVLSSGYDEQEATNNFSDKDLAGFLQKPYRASELLEKITEIIKE